jgi:hypothetical protein
VFVWPVSLATADETGGWVICVAEVIRMIPHRTPSPQLHSPTLLSSNFPPRKWWFKVSLLTHICNILLSLVACSQVVILEPDSTKLHFWRYAVYF